MIIKLNDIQKDKINILIITTFQHAKNYQKSNEFDRYLIKLGELFGYQQILNELGITNTINNLIDILINEEVK